MTKTEWCCPHPGCDSTEREYGFAPIKSGGSVMWCWRCRRCGETYVPLYRLLPVLEAALAEEPA